MLHVTFRRRAPRRTMARAIGLGATALLGAALLAWSPQPASGWDQGAAEGTLWQLMNGARVNNGRSPLQRNGTLVNLARWRSKDQVDRNYFDHTILGTNYQVYHWYDTNGLSYSWGGENIGWNNGFSDSDSPVMIHEGFMGSPGHRANVLEPSFTHAGVGAHAANNVNWLGAQRSPRFYTELFMKATGGTTPPPPPPPPPTGGPPPPPTGGGTAPAPAPAAPAQPAPTAASLRVDTPAAPRGGGQLDGGSVVARAIQVRLPATAAARALDVDLATAVHAEAAPAGEVATNLRVESQAAVERGLFETMLGSVLGFFL